MQTMRQECQEKKLKKQHSQAAAQNENRNTVTCICNSHSPQPPHVPTPPISQPREAGVCGILQPHTHTHSARITHPQFDVLAPPISISTNLEAGVCGILQPHTHT